MGSEARVTRAAAMLITLDRKRRDRRAPLFRARLPIVTPRVIAPFGAPVVGGEQFWRDMLHASGVNVS